LIIITGFSVLNWLYRLIFTHLFSIIFSLADWLFFTAHLNRHWNLLVGNNTDKDGNSINDSPSYLSLEYYKLQGLSSYITGGLIFSFTIYLTTGLFLHVSISLENFLRVVILIRVSPN
jgi:hypothetical protein